MTARRVTFTRTAQAHVLRENAWWRENRDYTETFARELDEALELVAVLPGAGASYQHERTPGLRRIYLSKAACHVYYTFTADEVIVRAVWGARRGHGPFDSAPLSRH